MYDIDYDLNCFCFSCSIKTVITSFSIKWDYKHTRSSSVAPADQFCCFGWNDYHEHFKAHLSLIPAGRQCHARQSFSTPNGKIPSVVSVSNLIISIPERTCYYYLRPPYRSAWYCKCTARRLVSNSFQHKKTVQIFLSYLDNIKVKKRRGEKLKAHLVQQKDAWIGQGHPQITAVSVTTAQLGWKSHKASSKDRAPRLVETFPQPEKTQL